MIDETYIEFTETNIYSSTKLVDTYNKLFVIRGTSKFFSTPGIRLGYGLIGDKSVKEDINKNLDLWNKYRSWTNTWHRYDKSNVTKYK